MPLSNLLKSAAGTCPFCRQKAGILSREHPECRRTYQAGWDEMVHLAAQAAASPQFDEKSLRLSLAEIASRSYGDDDTINQALEAGWKQGVSHAMADGIVSQPEEARLREFRDRLALDASAADQKAADQLEKASTDRLTLDARLAAIATQDPDTHLNELSESLRTSGLPQDEQTAILIRAWEAAVEGVLEDGLLTLDEENSLYRYLDHFNITTSRVNDAGVHTSIVKAAVIREITEGVVPQRQNIQGKVPFNLMKSEQLVWVMEGVDYLETVVRRENRGSSHGLSIRVARGVYYRPGTFRSRTVEWEGTVHGESYRLREKRHAGLFSSHHLLGVGAENGNDNYTD